ncbi:quinon protein alcohol dehydrogenase-like superfamily [Catenaria anguillulae PL171]|uniref:Quinon protein alcohol dehydrogenase-like superfamily n=1 Tax=Catenaria anguillulae PL171 TaxID=765915 RepID=A0A1Y2HJF0_9FUNG|nr:quinon protein alcohol dehydrogenase-like superfamily [Catenaria anguillulae PL171]
MELKCVVSPDAHPKPITCIAYHLVRREVFTGCEDSIIRSWDTDSGTPRLTATFEGHTGWVTAMVYCKEIKCLVSSSQDGSIIAWSNSGKILQKIQSGAPVYSLAWNSRRNQLMCGQKGMVRVYQAKDDFQVVQASSGGNSTNVPDLIFDLRDLHIIGAKGIHTDIVSCLYSCEARFYSAGFDRKIVIYESPPHGSKVQVVQTINDAHEAGICCLSYAKDAENAWLMTGSFDRSVKLWSLDGNCLQRFDGFLDSITGLTYVPPVQTLWITANSLFPIFLDPRSGVNISDFVKADNEKVHDKSASLFKQLHFLPESSEVVAVTARRQMVVWRFNPGAPVTTLECLDAVDALTVTKTDPILIFSAGINAVIQWERMQLNTFMYARESLPIHSVLAQIAGLGSMAAIRKGSNAAVFGGKAQWKPGSKPMAKSKVGSFAGLRKPDSGAEMGSQLPNAKLTATTMLFFDPLDYLIAAFEERRVVVWGYQDDSEGMPGLGVPGMNASFMQGEDQGNEAFANRVSGLAYKYHLEDHREAVTSVVVCEHSGSFYLLTSGWDRRIFIYDLRTGTKLDVFKDPSSPSGREELAADAPVLDMSVRPTSLSHSCEPQFAYASADKLVYVRKFSPRGDSMTLVGVLHGHEAEVNKVVWNGVKSQWVTGSEDKTLRLWDPHTLQCLTVINNESPVTTMCLDDVLGMVVTGARDRVIRVFDGEKLVQRNIGHTDEIRAIAHIQSRKQYVSSSWDGTIRIWNAYNPGRGKRGEDTAAAAANAGGLSSLDSSANTGSVDALRVEGVGKNGGMDKEKARSSQAEASLRAKSELASAVSQLENVFLSEAGGPEKGGPGP